MTEGRKAGLKTNWALCVCQSYATYYAMHQAVEVGELTSWPTYVGKWEYGTLGLEASIEGMQLAVD